MRVCIIGGGFSGVTAASVLQQRGIEAVVYERESCVGGVWVHAYPTAQCQNIASGYHLPTLSWEQAGIRPSLNPTKPELLGYLTAAVQRLKLDVRLSTSIDSCTRGAEDVVKWTVRGRGPAGEFTEEFDFLLVATGMFGMPVPMEFPGQDTFRGRIIGPNDMTHEVIAELQGKTLAVVGFGKCALDQATDAANAGVRTIHVFRKPGWGVPHRLLGVHYSWALWTRLNTVMVPCWDHPTAAARLLHARARALVRAFWALIEAVIWNTIAAHAWRRGAAAHARVALLRPPTPFIRCFRPSLPILPPRYPAHVASGAIAPVRSAVAGLCPQGLRLVDGRVVEADVIGLCIGHGSPVFPFLPKGDRVHLEGMTGGVQLYRHLVHPLVPGVGFVGMNHGFLHMTQVEIGTLWLSAMMRGELLLPPVSAQLAAADAMRAWKAANEQLCPATNCCVTAHYPQYNDVLLGDLGVRTGRQTGARALLAYVTRMGASDYAGVVAEYEERLRSDASRSASGGGAAPPRRVLDRVM